MERRRGGSLCRRLGIKGGLEFCLCLHNSLFCLGLVAERGIALGLRIGHLLGQVIYLLLIVHGSRLQIAVGFDHVVAVADQHANHNDKKDQHDCQQHHVGFFHPISPLMQFYMQAYALLSRYKRRPVALLYESFSGINHMSKLILHEKKKPFFSYKKSLCRMHKHEA